MINQKIIYTKKKSKCLHGIHKCETNVSAGD